MICVTGATGRLGTFVRAHIERKGLDQFIFQSRNPPKDVFGNWVNWSLNGSTIPQELESVDTIIHLAGTTHTGQPASDHRDFEESNVQVTKNLLHAVEGSNVSKILIASSASVYGKPKRGQPILKETDLTVPLNEYGKSKLSMENAVFEWNQTTAVQKAHILRIGNIFGADQLVQNALKLESGKELFIDQFESGLGPLRSYIGPIGLAKVLVQLATTDQTIPDVLNVADAPGVRMESLIEALSEFIEIEWRFRPAPDSAIEEVVLDTSELESLLDLRNKESMENACRKFAFELNSIVKIEKYRDDQKSF